MEQQRALLDELMGAERNRRTIEEGAQRSGGRERRFFDREVDKLHLLGCSPYELLRGTKNDPGPNPKVADDKCKKEWEALSEAEKARYPYEDMALSELRRVLQNVDMKIARNRQRCFNVEPAALEADARKVMEHENRIEAMLTQIPKIAAAGQVRLAYEKMATLEAEKKSIERLMQVPESQKRMLMCEVSGNLISRGDNDDRLASHFSGRQYNGLRILREKLKELEEKHRNKRNGDHRPPVRGPEPYIQRRRHRQEEIYPRHRSQLRSRDRSYDERRHRSGSRDRRDTRKEEDKDDENHKNGRSNKISSLFDDDSDEERRKRRRRKKLKAIIK